MQLFQKSWPLYLFAILAVNLLQSFCSELAHDEAYYWVYSQHLDWGYFDHPPAIALLIGAGYTLLENELGVRLFVVLANLLTIYLMFRMTKPKQPALFFALLMSCVIAHVGFFAAPDIPLLLTVALFFFFYQKYVKDYDWKNALWLGLTIAAMGYSKYHGIVVLVSVLLSNFDLFRKKTFYFAVLIATLSFGPHLYWQYIHDFPTFRFHLFDRSAETYTIAFIGEYVLGQLLIFGPLIGGLLFWAAYKFKSKDVFERSLKFSFFGIFGFFLLSSLKGRVEPNWTAMGMVPLIYLSYHYISKQKKLRIWAYRLAIPSLLLILAFRLILVVEVLPKRVFPLAAEFHGWKNWANDLSTAIGDRPALFINSYQRASKFGFYGRSQGFAINNAGYAGSQYDLLIEEQEQLQGKEVAIVHLVDHSKKGIWLDTKDKVNLELLDQFYFYNRLKVKTNVLPERLVVGSSSNVAVEVCNPTRKTIQISGNKELPLGIGYVMLKVKHWAGQSQNRVRFTVDEIKPGDCVPMTIPITAPDQAGEYRYRLSIYNGVYDERNDNFHPLEVVNSESKE